MTRYELFEIHQYSEKILQYFNLKPPIKNLINFLKTLNVIVKYTSEYSLPFIKIKKDGRAVFNIPKHENKFIRKKDIIELLGYLLIYLKFNYKLKKLPKKNLNKQFKFFSSEIKYKLEEFSFSFLMPKVIFLNIVEVHTDENNNCNINKVSNHFKVTNQHVVSWGKRLGIF